MSQNTNDAATMRLRDHPVMLYRGSSMWPPIWVGIGATQGIAPHGEVGRLREARRYPDKPRRIFLTMEYAGTQYTGALLFDDDLSCAQVYKLLQRYYESLILEIGNLEVPFDLELPSVYRKGSACQTWHFCRNCSHWPEDDFQELTILPEMGELCNQCKMLQEERNCQ
jgi:hypothetical protein